MTGKRSKHVAILGGVLAVSCLLTLFVMDMEQKKEDIRASGEVILELPADQITALSWSSEEKPPISLHKEADHWYYDGDESFPVDDDKIRHMLEQFESFSAAFTIEQPDSLRDYGLDSPTSIIELTAGDQTVEIRLGAFSEMDSQRYASIGDDNVYLLEKDPWISFDVYLSDLIQNDEIPSFGQVLSMKIQGDQAMQVTWQKTGGPSLRKDDCYFTEQDGELVPLDPLLVEEFLQNLSMTTLHEYVSYHVTDQELKQFGLDQPQLTITVVYKDEKESEQSFTIQISRLPGESSTADSENEEEDITAYARVSSSPIVYQLSADDYKRLMACSYNDLRHHQVLPVDFSSIEQMDVTMDENTYTLTVEHTNDASTLHYFDTEADAVDVQNALTSLTALEFTDTLSAEKPELALALTLKEHPNTTIRISLDRYDGTRCLAVVNGTPFALVDRTQVVRLAEALRSIVLEQPFVQTPD